MARSLDRATHIPKHAGSWLMVQSRAATVKEYLDELPEERRAVVAVVRKTIRRHLPAGYVERMNWGMITYEVPLKRYPETYNGQPLCYAALAAQKNYFSLYIMSVYQDSEQEALLRQQFREAGKKLNMGKSCLRFKKLEDLPLDLVGQVIASTPVEKFIQQYEGSRRK